MGKNLKKALALLFAVIMLVSVVPVNASAEDATSGLCGENVNWSYNTNTKKLTISGTGEMYDLVHNRPWENYKSLIDTVVIENGVTSIGRLAFYECTELTSVTIPDSVTIIGISAFWGCTRLTSVIIGNGVKSISESAFHGCSELANIVFPDSLINIGHDAFGFCAKLTSITIPDNVASIDWGAFSHCDELTSVTIGKNVNKIGESAFDCTGLESIMVSERNTKYHSCGNCLIETESKTLILGCKNSVIPDNGSVTSIGVCAFYGCDGLTSIKIPDSVTNIAIQAFYFCDGLTSVKIGNGVTNIGESAFKGCSMLESVTIGNSLISVGYCAFSFCPGISDVYYSGTKEQRSNMTIENGNDYLLEATWHYSSSETDDPYKEIYSITDDNPNIPNETRLINNFTSSRSVDYKTTITFSAPDDISKGATVHWIVNGRDAAQGNTYTNKNATESFTVQSKVVDAEGNVIAESEVETVKVNTGFFARFVAFFKSLFGSLPVINQ